MEDNATAILPLPSTFMLHETRSKAPTTEKRTQVRVHERTRVADGSVHSLLATWGFYSSVDWSVGPLTAGGAGGAALKLHRCTVRVKVMALLRAEVVTAVRNTARLERRPMRAIGPSAVGLRRQGCLYSPRANLDYSRPRGTFDPTTSSGQRLPLIIPCQSEEAIVFCDRPRDGLGSALFRLTCGPCGFLCAHMLLELLARASAELVSTDTQGYGCV